MSAWIIPPVHNLIEPIIAPEFHVDGIGAVEIANGCVRLYLFAEQMMLDDPTGNPAKVVTAKVTGPLCNVPTVISQLARCLLPRPSLDKQDGPWPRVVK